MVAIFICGTFVVAFMCAFFGADHKMARKLAAGMAQLFVVYFFCTLIALLLFEHV